MGLPTPPANSNSPFRRYGPFERWWAWHPVYLWGYEDKKAWLEWVARRLMTDAYGARWEYHTIPGAAAIQLRGEHETAQSSHPGNDTQVRFRGTQV